MRVAALYDIHGNLPALEAALRGVRAAGVDRVVVGGDVLPGPMPGACLDLLFNLDLPTDFIKGNGEAEVLTCLAGKELVRVPHQFRRAIEWTAESLDDGHVKGIRGWHAGVSVEVVPLGDVLYCHAVPSNDTDIVTRLTPEERLVPVFAGCPPTVVCGHTHMPFDRMVGNVRVVNAGSVGTPYGEPGAHWLLVSDEIEHRREEYDRESAAAAIRRTGYPLASEFAADVLEPPSEARMLDLFTRAGL